MAKKKNLGYLNPDTQAPDDEDNIFLVCVPCGPEYKRAFVGSLDGLAKWTNWDKGPDNKAILTADRFKLSNWRTSYLWQNGGIMKADRLIEALEKIADNSGCCCGGTEQVLEDDPTPINTRNSNDPPPAGMGVTWNEFDQQLCNNAYTVIEKLIENIGTLQYGLLASGAGFGFVGSTLTFLGTFAAFAAVPPVAAIAALVAASVGIVATIALDGATEAVTANIDALVCAIVEAPNPEQAKIDFEEAIDTLVGNEFLTTIMPFMMWQDVYNAIFTEPVNNDTVRDCSHCTPPASGSTLIYAAFGTLVLSEGQDGDIYSVEANSYQKTSNGTYYCSFLMNLDEANRAQYDQEFEQTANIPLSKFVSGSSPVTVDGYSSTGATQIPGAAFYRSWLHDQTDAQTGFSENFASGLNDDVRVVIFTSSTPFTVVINIENPQ